MLLEQTASQLNKLSISRLVLADEPPARPSTPKDVRLPEPVRVRGDEEDCARILAGLSSPAYEPIDTFAKGKWEAKSSGRESLDPSPFH